MLPKLELMLFADDTIIFYSHENIDYMISIFNKDVEKLNKKDRRLDTQLTINS